MNLFRNTSEYLKCRSFVIQSVNVRKNNTFAVNLLSTVDRKHGIIDIDLIRQPNNHYCKMSGNGSHHLYTEGTGWLYPNGGKSTIFPPKL